jgi:signal transduction histidine kinase
MQLGTEGSTQGVLAEAEFLRGAAPDIDRGLFQARFANWRLSVAGTVGMVWMIGSLYNFVVPVSNVLWWAAVESVVFLLIGASCFIYERVKPAPDSQAQQRWLQLWTVGSAVCGAMTGLLPWFLPADRIDLQLSATATVSMLMIAFAVSRAHRPLVYTMVGAQTVAMCLALALHSQLPLVIPVCLLQAVFVLAFSLKLSGSMRAAIGQRLYAQHLLTELQRTHARQQLVQQREAVLNERQRMLAELQDSLGTHLIAALRQLESGRIDSVGAASILRECVTDLRLLVGNAGPATRSFAALLGIVRHRLQRRIDAAGVQLSWQIEDLADAGTLAGGQALDLLGIVQEAIENVLQHAGASEMAVTMHKSARELEITVEDDGRGLDPQLVMQSGRGIAAMQRRAARLGAILVIEAGDVGGTVLRLRLRLPLGGPAAASAHGAAA